MIPLIHFFASLILFCVLFSFFGWFSLLVFVGGVLIDVDHYLDYIILKRDFSLRRAYLFFKDYKGPKTVRLHLFHTVEFWFLLLVLSFFSMVVMIFSFGVLLHMLMDLHNLTLKNKISKSPSIILWLFKKRWCFLQIFYLFPLL